MSYGQMAKEVSAYRSTGVQSEINSASPHRIIQMLMEGALDKIAMARGFVVHEKKAEAGSHISWAISIIDGLRMSLNHDISADVVKNLDALYDYMNRRLAEANLKQDIKLLDEVSALMREIKTGWDAIPEEHHSAHQHPAKYLKK